MFQTVRDVGLSCAFLKSTCSTGRFRFEQLDTVWAPNSFQNDGLTLALLSRVAFCLFLPRHLRNPVDSGYRWGRTHAVWSQTNMLGLAGFRSFNPVGWGIRS